MLIMMLMIVISMIMMDGVAMQEDDNGEMCEIIASVIWDCKPSTILSDPKPPSSKCCKTLKKVDFECLCYFASSTLKYPFGIDDTLFLRIFDICRLPKCPLI
ncbi:putative lipid-transfer protein DIR1 [Bienertia sinuspersici]